MFKDNLITDPIGIANCFNDYFSTIADEIVSDIPPTSANFESYIPNLPSTNFQFALTNCEKVKEVILNLESKPTLDINGYNTVLIKRNVSSILMPLTHIINLSLKEGIFPDSLKTSRVCPIFKSGEK